jgi:hypothetical protein
MDPEYLRQRVRHFLAKEAMARSGGDLNYNPGLLIGDGRKRAVGRPRKVGRPTLKAVKRRKAVGGARPKKAAKGNMAALSEWRKFFDGYRRRHPNMAYREAQQKAAAEYRRR